MVDRDPLLGATISEHYTIDACIAYGATSMVYRAHHSRLTRRAFAIKVLLGDHIASAATRIRFAQEAELLSRLNHPNVVSVVDFARTPEGLLYLVMDLASGPSLAELIRLSGPLPWRRVVELSRQMLQGLAHAHDHGIVHRDFKPDNVIVEYAGELEIPRIVDFGIALTTHEHEASPRITGVGWSMGTPAYAAPEQTRNLTVDHRADLFALGVTMYEMLAGKLPFDGTATELVYANALTDPPPLQARAPGVEVPPELEHLVLRLMRREPAQRFRDAADVLHELEHLPDLAPAPRASMRAMPAHVPTVVAVPDPPPARAFEPMHAVPARREETLVVRLRDVKPATRWPYYLLGIALTLVGTAAAAVAFSPQVRRALNVAVAKRTADGATSDERRAPLAPELVAATVAIPEPAPLPTAPEPSPEELAAGAAPVPATADEAPEDGPEASPADPQPEGEPRVASASAEAIEPAPSPHPASARPRPAPRAKTRSSRSGAARAAAEVEEGPEPADELVETTPSARPVTRWAPTDEPAPAPVAAPLPVAPAPVAATLPAPTPLPAAPRPAPPPAAPVKRALGKQSLEVAGSLSLRTVERAVNRVRGDLAACAKLATEDAVTVRFVIDERGRASSIKVGSASAPLARCVRSALDRVRTESPPDVGTVDSTLKLTFPPSAP
ncbi:MAG: protein kinase [Kofleriaceae bacterium]